MERFWSKVNIKGEDECWEWLAHKNQDGYGRIRMPKDFLGVIFPMAHRVAYKLVYGEIPRRYKREKQNA